MKLIHIIFTFILTFISIFRQISNFKFLEDSNLLTSEEVESLTYNAFQLYKCCPDSYLKLKEILNSNFKREKINWYPKLFAQQKGIYPKEGEYQLENFGVSKEDYSLIKQSISSGNSKLILMIRHGQAWENLNPIGNENCEFELEGQKVQNFDSPLTPLGHDQTKYLNNNREFKELLERFKINQVITSPLMRTMQTSQNIFKNFKSKSDITVTPEELIRASLGKDVCNARKSVHGKILKNEPPFETNCKRDEISLMELFEDFKELNFKIKPIGSNTGLGGLISDHDELWRSDLNEPDELLSLRAKAFIIKLKSLEQNAFVVVTHGEMIDIIYKIFGEEDKNSGYSAKNSEVVPILINYK